MTVPGNLSSPLLATAADAAAAGANITKSLRFNSGDSANLHRTPSSAGNRKTWTFAAWIKLSDVGTSDRQVFSCRVSGTAQIQIGQSGSALIGFNEYGIFDLRTSRLMRDPGAWFHLCCVFDSTNSTSGDRARIYVNGVRETDFSTETYPSQNAEASWNRAERHNIGSLQPSYANYFDGYMTDIYFIDGSALDPVNNFIEADSNGVYQVKEYTGTYGANGFHLLDFANEAGIGHDSSGNENDFTAVNFVASVGKAFTTAKIYSVYSDATVVSNYSVQYSDNNSSWTTAFSGTISNNGAYGLQSGTNPGDGSYGFHKYWRYVVGSVVTTHHPRCSRIVLSDGVSDVNIHVFTSDNTSDQGGIPGAGATYTYTDSAVAADVDVLVDVPTNGGQSDTGAGGEVNGNYCVLNPIDANSTASFANGNLDWTGTNGNGVCRGTIAVSSGKWYWEYTYDAKPSGGGTGFGILEVSEVRDFIGAANAPDGYSYYSEGSSFTKKYNNGSNSNYGASFAPGDVISVALDMDGGTITFYKNGASQGQAFSGISGTYAPALNSGTSVGTAKATFNAGQRAFAYSAPSGFKALCTANLPTPTIADGSDYFEAAIWTGDSANSRTITTGFDPDLVWVKNRGVAGRSHYLYDAVRGFGANKELVSNATKEEGSSGHATQNHGYVSGTTSTGFTLAAGATNSNYTNQSGQTYVGWVWDASANSNKTYTVKVVSDSGNKYRFDDFGTSAVTLNLEEGSTYVFDQSDSSNANHPIRFGTSANGTDYTTGVTHTGTPGSAGAKTTLVLGTGVATLYYSCANHSGMGGQINTNSTAGASNFDGSIQATVRASQTAGFSIINYVGTGANATVGHGLNAEIGMIIIKNRDRDLSNDDWRVWHSSLAANERLVLNAAKGKGSDTTLWQNTLPTSTKFYLDSDNRYNYNGDNHIAYCFSPVAGFSAMGSFVGNLNADGPYIHCGFRPAFILCKRIDVDDKHWILFDNKRYGYNVDNLELLANLTATENNTNPIDILSNGFKIRAGTSPDINGSGGTIIYYAVAENPFQANGGLAR